MCRQITFNSDDIQRKLYWKKHSAAGVEGSGVIHNKTTSKTTAEVMSTYTGRRNSDQGQHNTAGKINADVYIEAQHGVVPGRRADAVNQPFPNKPVSHRRSLQPTKQDALVPYDLEKNTITKPRGRSLTLEHYSNGTGKTDEYQDPRKDSGGRQPSGELQMARAIHAKELVLQGKLWRVEEKIRQKNQRDTAALDDQKSEQQRHNREQAERGNSQRESRLSEQQRREPVRRREVKMQESRQEDVKQHMKTQDQEERARGKRREIEVAQSHKKGHKATHRITVPEQEVSGELTKPRWGNVKEHTGRKERDERNNGIWEDTGVKSQDGTVKAKERHQNTAYTGDTGWRRENKYRERTCKEIYDDEQDMPQVSQQRASHKDATEGRKPSGGPRLPPLSHPSHSSRPELRQEDSTDTRHQLLLCKICNRKFAGERLQKHVQICEKVNQSKRGVFNAYLNRTKGSVLEEFLKTHSISPEVLKKNNQRQNQGNTKKLHKGRLPGGTKHQPK